MTTPTPDLPPLPKYRIDIRQIPAGMIWEAAFDPDGDFYSVREVDALLADRAAGRALEAVPEWIPVGDRKPARYGQHVLVLTTNADDEPHAVTACWNGDKLFLGTGGRRIDPVTHWMAIPSLAATPAASPVPVSHPNDDYRRIGLLEWAVSKWRVEVENRPLVNVHRRTLDDTWRQVIRYAGGDPTEIVGPNHDALLSGDDGHGC